MKVLPCNPNYVWSYADSKDDVDNRTNESHPLKDNQSITTSTTVSPNNTTMTSVTSTPTISSQMSNTDLLKFEEQRLKSFERGWPHSFISPRVLAKTGFYFIGPHDQVRCYFCKVEVSRWENGDNEVAEHSRWSPNCPLLKRRETTNVPIEPGK